MYLLFFNQLNQVYILYLLVIKVLPNYLFSSFLNLANLRFSFSYYQLILSLINKIRKTEILTKTKREAKPRQMTALKTHFPNQHLSDNFPPVLYPINAQNIINPPR